MLDREPPAKRSLSAAADTRAEKQRAGQACASSAPLTGPAALVTSQLAEGSDNGPPPAAGPPGTPTLPVAMPRGSADQTGGPPRVERVPLNLASGSVQCNRRSEEGPGTPGPTDPREKWWADLQNAYSGTLRDRGRQQPRVRKGLSRSLRDRVDGCGASFRLLGCGCRKEWVPASCERRWLCDHCRRRYYKRMVRRLSKACWAVEQRLAHRRLHWVTMRLSIRQEGTLDERRQLLQQSWQRLRAWIAKRTRQRKLPYAGSWEVTATTDHGRQYGNLHLHLIALYPWVDYGDWHDEWVRATEGRACAVAGCSAGDDHEHVHVGSFIKSLSDGAGAAVYLAKYQSKGVEVAKMPAALAGDVLGAFYWRRLVQTSAHWWLPTDKRCHCCGERWALLSDWVAAAEGIDLPSPVGRGPPSEVRPWPISEQRPSPS